jgi:hypothetical protein
MAINYDVPPNKVFAIAGGCTVTVKGTHEHPLIVDTLEELVESAPTIESLEPSSVEIGAPDFTLLISGQGFDEYSTIVFGAYDEPTTLDPVAGTLSTIVKPSLFKAPDTVPIKVRNGPAYSAAFDFSFIEPGSSGGTTRKRRGAHAPQE